MLKDFQLALGTAVRTRRAPERVPAAAWHAPGADDDRLSHGERTFLNGLGDSPGFWFTAGVQRAWCELRTRNAARVVLSSLLDERARKLVDSWVEQGGGTSSFFASEADDLLEFIAARLLDDGAARALCRVEQAVRRANQATSTFKPRGSAEIDSELGTDVQIRHGRDAALVRIPGASDLAVLFAPGIPDLHREAQREEIILWRACAAPRPIGALVRRKRRRQALIRLLTEGVLDIVAGSS